jgi:hypothetical protein
MAAMISPSCPYNCTEEYKTDPVLEMAKIKIFDPESGYKHSRR